MITTTLISTIIGLIGSLLPSVIEIFKSKQDATNEVKLLEARAEYNKLAAELKVKELNVQADIDETKSIHDSDAAIDGGKFVNAFRAIIRPLITLVFFLVFVGIKVYAVYYATQVQHIDLINLLPIIWDDDTAAIFSAIMGFWFGSRTLDRYYTRKNEARSEEKLKQGVGLY